MTSTLLRYRILDILEDGQWVALGAAYEAGPEVVRYCEHNFMPRLQKSLTEVLPSDFPGSWTNEDLRLSEVREAEVDDSHLVLEVERLMDEHEAFSS
jgi:hypothetical protein